MSQQFGWVADRYGVIQMLSFK